MLSILTTKTAQLSKDKALDLYLDMQIILQKLKIHQMDPQQILCHPRITKTKIHNLKQELTTNKTKELVP